MTALPRPSASDSGPRRPGEVLLGEDWVVPPLDLEPELRDQRRRRGLLVLNASPLARKIVLFNLLALLFLTVGILYGNPQRPALVALRQSAMVTEAEVYARLLATRAGPFAAGVGLGPGPADRALAGLAARPDMVIRVVAPDGATVAARDGPRAVPAPADRETVLVDLLEAGWILFLPPADDAASVDAAALRGRMADQAARAVLAPGSGAVRLSDMTPGGSTMLAVAVPVVAGGVTVGAVALALADPAIDIAARRDREQVLRVFIVSLLVSMGLSLLLASTIANPLSDLAAAAEMSRSRDARRMAPGRVRIPDLTARPDEIGRLSVAMRGMVAALYDRIDANEQFAADVAHELKNPLASLRSAVGSFRRVKKEEHRAKLLEVIEHDVRRLDRLVSDISNASRLDSELVKEEEEEFDLVHTIREIGGYLGDQASEKGVDFITDLPAEPITIRGLEARLAQVFVNLISNAVSFCGPGDAVRVWARRRENRVLVVVEDTGPGIPEQALTKIFKRFYSERPEGQFGNHSGLGLAISKQIVEAHGGVIWAENIRPTSADAASDPLGARFVVGLPV